MSVRASRRSLLLLAAVLAIPRVVPAADPPVLRVYAAASLADVLEAIGDDYAKSTGIRIEIVAAASSALARQIESGARADVFVSADQEWMDYLARRGLVDPSTRQDIAGNSLVLIAPANARPSLKIGPGPSFATALTAALGDGRLSVAEVETVPAGRYAKAALTSLGAWDAVKDRLASAENVRSALAFVARGEAPLGIVYGTDARIDRKVAIVDTFPPASHAPITYPAAAVQGGAAGAGAFVKYLQGEAAQRQLAAFGFTQ